MGKNPKRNQKPGERKLNRLLNRPLIFSSLFVLLAAGLCLRLGFWQLERLTERREFNQHTQAQLDAEVLQLDKNTLSENLEGMEYRKVSVKGEYYFEGQVYLRNQVWINLYGVRENGYHLLTPLKISGTQMTVLVDRGWIPDIKQAEEYYVKGEVVIRGYIRLSESDGFGLVQDPTLAPGENGLKIWNLVNLERISQQSSLEYLPIYIMLLDDGDESLPYQDIFYLELSEGGHLGYAIQWFAFACVFVFGYLFLVFKRQTKEKD